MLPTRAAVLTVSDRAFAGVREDASGPVLAGALREAGFDVTSRLVADGAEEVADAIRALVAEGARVVLTTGGTGLTPGDRTPEGTRAVVDREAPGIMTLLVTTGLGQTPYAALTRGVAGVVDASAGRRAALVVNLPGSVKAVREGAAVLMPMLGHIVEQLDGGDHR